MVESLPESRGTLIIWTDTDQAISLLENQAKRLREELETARAAAVRIREIEKKLKAIWISLAALGSKSEQRKPRASPRATSKAIEELQAAGKFEALDIDQRVPVVRDHLKATGVDPLPQDGTIRKSLLAHRAARQKATNPEPVAATS